MNLADNPKRRFSHHVIDNEKAFRRRWRAFGSLTSEVEAWIKSWPPAGRCFRRWAL